ncbi:3-hydroxyacyl-CoA dehydrogenase NAD-binding domain-containing protein [Actinoplanes sp. NPDC051859]|uniref:3-hydroxyacyl-CoA dehydrogenase NAD-binding domain-containing protein n=1 Tax=Actinoplanes sp. NPDC051859 TaxID=3363909 RepID=UPI0037A96FB6
MPHTYRYPVRTVGVVGGGVMGSGIALTYALAGHDVVVVQRSAESCTATEDRLDGLTRQLVRAGSPDAGRMSTVRRRITTTTDLSQLAVADYVVEAVAEDAAVKQQVHAAIDEIAAPDVVVASASTAIPVDVIAQDCKHAERVIGTRFYLPAPLVPLVDVVRGTQTVDGAVDIAVRLLGGAGKRTVTFDRHAAGATGPRLQTALINEGLRIVDEGLVDPETLDRILTQGVGRRFGVTGVFDRLDFAGLDTVAATLRNLGRPVPAPIEERLQQGRLGVKSGAGFYEWSDERIAAVEDALARQLTGQAAHERASLPTAAGPQQVVVNPAVLRPFLDAALEAYRTCTPEEPPGCFALLVGRMDADRMVVERAVLARNVRGTDQAAAGEYEATIVPCFGAAYDNANRGFWCHAVDQLKVHREAEADGLEVLGSIHLHPDWHRIGPDHERGMQISQHPTAMDAYMIQQTQWPLNLICYVEGAGDVPTYTIGAWAPPTDGGNRCHELTLHWTV